MRIRVTASSIQEYGLDTLTGNTKEDLVRRMEEMEAAGYELFVTIPDAFGGTTESPDERNVFDHFNNELPEPDGAVHSQASVNLSVGTECHYKQVFLPGPKVNYKWVCLIHGAASKHDVESRPNAPCISIDPLGDHIWT